jgi:hypothetical protein
VKIKMLVGMAGTNFTVNPNQETDRFSDSECINLITAGFAVPVEEEKIETAVKPLAPERRRKGR